MKRSMYLINNYVHLNAFFLYIIIAIFSAQNCYAGISSFTNGPELHVLSYHGNHFLVWADNRLWVISSITGAATKAHLNKVPGSQPSLAAYGNGEWLVMSYGGVYISRNGLNWHYNNASLTGYPYGRDGPGVLFNPNVNLLFSKNEFYYLVDDRFYTSENGLNWTAVSLPNVKYHDKVYQNTYNLIACNGSAYLIYTSPHSTPSGTKVDTVILNNKAKKPYAVIGGLTTAAACISHAVYVIRRLGKDRYLMSKIKNRVAESGVTFDFHVDGVAGKNTDILVYGYKKINKSGREKYTAIAYIGAHHQVFRSSKKIFPPFAHLIYGGGMFIGVDDSRISSGGSRIVYESRRGENWHKVK
ncbi:MAG: hypothetical protein ACYCUY_00660 [Acidithiobacillus sp.]